VRSNIKEPGRGFRGRLHDKGRAKGEKGHQGLAFGERKTSLQLANGRRKKIKEINLTSRRTRRRPITVGRRGRGEGRQQEKNIEYIGVDGRTAGI